MMTPVKQQYAELLALTKLYLIQEHAPNERIFADSDSYHYFREYAMRKMQHTHSPSIKQQPPSEIVSTHTLPTTPKLPSLTPPQIVVPATQQAIPTSPPPPEPPQPTPNTVAKISPETPYVSPSRKSPAQPLPVPTKEESPSQPSTVFALEVPPAATPHDLKEIWGLVKERLPGLELLANPPNDTIAKEAAKQWERKPTILEVAILSFETEPKHKAFLDNLSKALKAYGISTVVVNAARAEQEKAWPRLLEAPHVRLIIAGGYGLYTLTTLMLHYVEGERSAGPKLGKVPLLMLSDAALYLKDPSLKASLWRSLKEILAIDL
jgi:hypothetical protein